MNNTLLKKGNLVFLQSTLMDLFYVVKGMEGEMVVARKIDAPPSQWEKLPLEKVVKIAGIQEKLLPFDVRSAIEEQRKVVFPTEKERGRKKQSLDKMMRGLPREGIEEILTVLAAVGMEEEEEEEKE